MAGGGSKRLDDAPPRLRVAVAFAIGALAGTAVAVLSADVLAPLVGWDVTVAVYLTWTWICNAGLDAATTARLAVREDPGRALTDTLLLVASVASLGGVGAVIATAGSRGGFSREVGISIAVASVVASWAMVHSVFTARYARLYYTGPDGGINFNEEEPPRYLDFAYMAFTVGMTYQVSDTNVTSKEMRAAVLGHSLLSYLLGSVTFAVTINLVVNLAR